MRILHVLYSARAEGTVRLALDWLGDSSLHQEIFVLSSDSPDLEDQLRSKAAWYMQSDTMPSIWTKFPWIMLAVWRICRRRKPDLVICWPNGFSPWILTGARLAGTRRLITHAGNPPNWHFKGKLQTVVSTFVAWAAGGRMVCCSHYVASEFARSPGAFASTLRVVPNCAPIDRIREDAAAARSVRKEGRFRFVMVATLELHKDHATLLRAMQTVQRVVPSAELWLVGDGSQRKALHQACESLGVSEAVTFWGSRADVPSLLGQSDVFVFSTTIEEGLGTVLVEALAAGLPVVASDVPACRETLSGGKWGTLVRAGDPEALAGAMVESLRGAKLEATAERSSYLQRFVPSRMIASYLEAAP